MNVGGFLFFLRSFFSFLYMFDTTFNDSLVLNSHLLDHTCSSSWPFFLFLV